MQEKVNLLFHVAVFFTRLIIVDKREREGERSKVWESFFRFRCVMALHKLIKPKTFHLDYCGCLPAKSLLNDQIIRDAIEQIRQTKSKRDFVKTTIHVSKDGLKITYHHEQKYSTIVPSTMIAQSTIGKIPLHNTVGVVYISPSTSQHYPAFVHVYRCDSSHNAQKFLSRLRSFLLIESHRLNLVQLEEKLFESFSPTKKQQIEPKVHPIKSITDELQNKINSHEPILFPPKDYDTIHAKHGNVQRAQAWRSTEVVCDVLVQGRRDLTTFYEQLTTH